MKITEILTKKLTAFWLLSLAAVAFIFLFIALVSFVQLTYKFQQHQMSEFELMLLQHQQQHQLKHLDIWLPQILSAYKAQHFLLTRNGEVVYQYENSDDETSLVNYERVVSEPLALTFNISLPQPFVLNNVSWHGMLIFLFGVAAIWLFVRWGHTWLAQQLEGVEELAKRSHLILSGDYDKALAESGHGRPRLINRALTQLLLELEDAQKQRARFDQFIRSNTFLDPETGIGNRLFLKNRLDALSNGEGMMAPGVLLLLEMEDLDLLQQEMSEEMIHELLSQTISGISKLLDTQANSIFSRRSYNQFAIVVPQISLADVEKLAAKLLKVCLAQPLDGVINQNDFFHIGLAYFKVGESKEQLLEEAEMALRAAQFQGNSSWFMYDKGAVDGEFARGTVRWRSFLEYALVNKRVVAFSQPVMDSDGLEHHKEISCRLRDNSGGLVRATLFLPMAIKCGLTPQIERQVIEAVLFDLLVSNANPDARYSINLSLDTLTSRAFIRWLKTTLLEYRHLASKLIFEVNEDILVHNIDKLRPPLDMISKMGASLCVDRVGQQVVSMEYIQACKIDIIKLHRSIVRQIHLRQENQLFVRSIIGGLYRSEVQFFAEGIESFEEWQTLKILGVSAGQGSLFSEPMEEV
ncbi:RNase E specificity factor CsrD [Shewanella psychrotolerans]|uniref:RNase E specificity factor CsrD n=1 Tax=Shewanella psychrotolerans TaxID=2864206 RepID=UPI001C65D618|nr:RNase E specificity factor CsrD [Shewanella psychrotolerans]QYK01787.1 RNase E specificity factor CsrD [Shewanella psychrotolerans]